MGARETTTVSCLVTPTWVSSMQLLLSRINADRHRNVLELLHVCSDALGPHAAGRRSNNGASSVRLLYHDYRVIAAFTWKNKAQHRVGRWWQRLEGVRRSLRVLFDDVHLETTNAEGGTDGTGASDGTAPAPTLDSSSSVLGFLHALERASQPVTTHQERRVPSRRACHVLTTALYQHLCRLETLLERAYAAAQACSAQLAHTFFMPLSLSGLSLAGRVYAIGVQLLREGVGLYNLVRGEVMDMLPSSGLGVGGEGGARADPARPAPPTELRCRITEGEVVRMEAVRGHGVGSSGLSFGLSELSSGLSGLSAPPSPPAGLQVLGSDAGASLVPAGLVVEEDHGLGVHQLDGEAWAFHLNQRHVQDLRDQLEPIP